MLRQRPVSVGRQGPRGQSLAFLAPGRQGGYWPYLGSDERGPPPSLICLPFPFFSFVFRIKRLSNSRALLLTHLTLRVPPPAGGCLYYATIHVSSSSIFPIFLWASGPLTECAKLQCCPVCLLEAPDCSPSFPVFLTSPRALSLMDSCSQSCQFQLSAVAQAAE